MLYENFQEKVNIKYEEDLVLDDHIMKLFNKILLPNILNFGTQVDNFLEIGCGDGRYARNIIKYVNNYVGIDIRDESLKFAIKSLGNYKQVVFYKNNGHDLSQIKDLSMDIVFSYQTFFYISKEEYVFEYLNEIFRVLKPNGFAKIQFAGKNIGEKLRLSYVKLGQSNKLYRLLKFLPIDLMFPVLRFSKTKQDWGKWGVRINPLKIIKFIEKKGFKAYVDISYVNGHLSSNSRSLYWIYIYKNEEAIKYVKIN
jgi:ubiquinone/menaquinone biosynthesis C-methylase UbiE